MSEIFQPLTGFRFVEIHFGDTLQGVAFRELGDASGWATLAAMNNLLPPYITDDPALTSDQVLRSGQMMMVPAVSTTSAVSTNPDQVFGTDCLLQHGRLVLASGDFVLAAGRENLRQALAHAVQTRRGELPFHPGYGCLIRRVIGTAGSQSAAILAAEYVKTTLADDDRVAQVTQALAVISGDVVAVMAEIIPIAGQSVNLKVCI